MFPARDQRGDQLRPTVIEQLDRTGHQAIVIAAGPGPGPRPSQTWARAAQAGRILVDHVDRRCRLAGLAGWDGEMNARGGRRARSLERLGGTVVHRAQNHTLSWLLGEPVERLTVARPLAWALGA